MKKAIIFVFLLYTVFFFSSSIHAQQVECDACGYCIGREEPGNWESCRECIYDKTTGTADKNETLRVTKTPGKYYTQLGCLDVGADSFTDPSAPGGLLNFLLSRLIFPIVGTLSFFSLIYGAFLLMTAQGASEQIGRGKSYVVGAIVGLLFTLSAILIINIIAGDILRIPGFSRTPKAEVSVRATTATVNGEKIFPILGVSINGNEIQAIDLAEGLQNISVSVPVNEEDLSNLEVLQSIVFTMKNDECYSLSTKRNPPMCCDPNPNMSESRKQRCADRENYNGDVNMYINSITINGNKCLSYTVNGVAKNPQLIISSTGSSVRCSTIEN